MFCQECGNEVMKGTKFCSKCGSVVNANEYSAAGVNMMQEPVVTQSANKKNKASVKSLVIIFLLALAVCLSITAAAFLLVFGDGSKTDFEDKLKEAEELVEDEEYKKAIKCYKELLEMEPKDESLYEALAELYVSQDKMDEAIEVLESGYDITESKKLKKAIDKYSDEDDGDDGDTEEAAESYTSEEAQADGETEVIEKKDINIEVRQVDNTNFPNISMYVSITDNEGNIVKDLDRTDFNIQEIDAQGNVSTATISDIYQISNVDNINMNLVLDRSGSMDSYNKMQQAKNAAVALIDHMDLTRGDQVEVISFDDYVYLEQEFTNQSSALKSAINNINTAGATALYDAIYAGLFQTYYETGAKCVVAFTDGMENASNYTFDDVVEMARNTSIPVFIIGIGDDGYDSYDLKNLATQCSGKYYSADVQDLENILTDIYFSIYKEQQDYYVVKYTASNTNNPTQFRDVVIETAANTEFRGSYKKSYVPQADITGAFSATYMNRDYILDFSSQRKVTESDLSGLGLAELRIARNEIFARHGRQFKDVMLNQWFYSKLWYLNIPMKYSPDTFDSINPSPLTPLELENAYFIKAYEENIMNTQHIYPNAGHELLSEYDLALSKPVLKNALSQMQTYASTNILEQNKILVQQAIDKEDIQY